MGARSHCSKDILFESVEYDPRDVEVATKYFGYNITFGSNTVEINDGGLAVEQRANAGNKYDVVLVDAFHEGHVPPSCRSLGFIQNLKRILKPNGYVMQNIWSPEYEVLIHHYRTVFGEGPFRFTRGRVKGWTYEAIGHVISAQA